MSISELLFFSGLMELKLFSNIPPHALSGYLDTTDIAILGRTHRYFATKYFKIVSPIIKFVSSKIDYGKILTQFPKVKFVLDFYRTGNAEVTRALYLPFLNNITSLNMPGRCYRGTADDANSDVARMSNLTAINLSNNRDITTETLGKLTNLVELNLYSNHRIRALEKLTKLERLDLSDNNAIDAIPAVSLRYLSLRGNTKISPSRVSGLTELEIGYDTKEMDVINRYTTISELSIFPDLNRGDIPFDFRTISRMTWLKGLTIGTFSARKITNKEDINKLTNLTYLNLDVIDTIDISCFQQLQTLKIGKRRSFLNKPLSEPYSNIFKKLTHLEIDMNVLDNSFLAELKVLRNLKILNSYFEGRNIDIYHLSLLTSLEIFGSDIGSFVLKDGIANRNLQRLSIDETETTLDDRIILGFPKLKYLILGNRPSLQRVRGSCFKNMDELFSVTIYDRNKFDKEIMESLIKRGIMIHHGHKPLLD
ncbi:MAG: hypothetical protein Hyperionvirus5_106 [Hyperionvirus sp.]|uniref:Leucine-rich repeat protein n=1 Tax=Hyperionvirus sp. TaxID=2487770 RepID=A0A3G5A7P7_9VIRU|nr:MAG: hypothetical protein Hyperionvirus5_106 [Hyperionvirus sp.]